MGHKRSSTDQTTKATFTSLPRTRNLSILILKMKLIVLQLALCLFVGMMLFPADALPPAGEAEFPEMMNRWGGGRSPGGAATENRQVDIVNKLEEIRKAILAQK